MSKTVDNIDVIIAIRDLCADIAKDAKLDIAIYPLVYPASGRPDEFILIKDFPQHSAGNVMYRGGVEICIYRKNLKKQNDDTTPDLERLKELTDIILPKLDDAIKNSVSIVSTKTTTVRHKEIKSYYQSIVCETISITNKSK